MHFVRKLFYWYAIASLCALLRQLRVKRRLKEKINYIGVLFERDCRMKSQIQACAIKAEKATMILQGIMYATCRWTKNLVKKDLWFCGTFYYVICMSNMGPLTVNQVHPYDTGESLPTS